MQPEAVSSLALRANSDGSYTLLNGKRGTEQQYRDAMGRDALAMARILGWILHPSNITDREETAQIRLWMRKWRKQRPSPEQKVDTSWLARFASVVEAEWLLACEQKRVPRASPPTLLRAYPEL